MWICDTLQYNSDYFFTQVPFFLFLKKMQKVEIDCPLPYEEVLEDIINPIVAVNSHQRWVFFANFSVNSKSISMKFCKHSFQLFRRLLWKFREIWMSISKVRPFDM